MTPEPARLVPKLARRSRVARASRRSAARASSNGGLRFEHGAPGERSRITPELRHRCGERCLDATACASDQGCGGGGKKAEQACREEGGGVFAGLGSDKPGAPGGGGGAKLVCGEDPCEDDA